MFRRTLAVCLLPMALVLPQIAAASTVGSDAPALEPTEWLNTKEKISWKDLKGRLILVEKWATWCGPCRTTIPHLNELHEKYEKKGLTVIGVSDEAAGTVKPFMEKLEMKYIIALAKAPEYKTSGIPHGWLVSPKGKIVWEGHPSGLKDSIIEEHIAGATTTVTPQFALPKELKSAESQLNAGKYADGIKSLENHLKKPKSPATETAAKEALEQVKAYGDAKLKQVEESAKEQDYGHGAEILRALQASFKGHEVGEQAKTLLADWKKDAKIKLELDGAALLEQADAQIQAKAWKNAAAALSQITRSKKFDGTKVKEVAAAKLATVQRKL